MNKLTLKQPYWIGFYFGHSCIIHPEHGLYTLTGYFDNQVVCHRTVNGEDECELFPVEDIQFVLRRINPFLFASMSKFTWFVNAKAKEGYWMNFDEQINEQIIFES